MPNSPQNDAGMRIDPAPSEPIETPHRPAAAATPAPPLEPPGVYAGFHGFRVAPNASVSVNGQIVSSGVSVLPTTIAPAERRRATTSESARHGSSLVARLPQAVPAPATSVSSLIETGTPSSGRCWPEEFRASAWSASASARSANTTR